MCSGMWNKQLPKQVRPAQSSLAARSSLQWYSNKTWCPQSFRHLPFQSLNSSDKSWQNYVRNINLTLAVCKPSCVWSHLKTTKIRPPSLKIGPLNTLMRLLSTHVPHTSLCTLTYGGKKSGYFFTQRRQLLWEQLNIKVSKHQSACLTLGTKMLSCFFFFLCVYENTVPHRERLTSQMFCFRIKIKCALEHN